jgi:hypothetical protein
MHAARPAITQVQRNRASWRALPLCSSVHYKRMQGDLPPAVFDQAFDGREYLVQVKRFGEVGDRSEFAGLQVAGLITTHHDNRNVRAIVAVEAVRHRPPAEPRQVEIEHDKRGAVRAQPRCRGRAIRRSSHGEAVILQPRAEDKSNGDIILDNEDLLFHWLHVSSFAWMESSMLPPNG